MTAETPHPMDAMLRASLDAYPERTERAALRCGLSDASAICDIIARKLMEENRGSMRGQRLAAIAKRCGDEIWQYRERIDVPR